MDSFWLSARQFSSTVLRKLNGLLGVFLTVYPPYPTQPDVHLYLAQGVFLCTFTTCISVVSLWEKGSACVWECASVFAAHINTGGELPLDRQVCSRADTPCSFWMWGEIFWEILLCCRKEKRKEKLGDFSIKVTELIHQSQVFSNSGHLFRNGQESQAFAVSLFVIKSLGVLCPN